jgi:peptide/nickel transport system permease protein
VSGVSETTTHLDLNAAEVTTASQWRIIWWRFRQHRLAMAGLVVLAAMYVVAVFAGFFAPNAAQSYDAGSAFKPPQVVRFSVADGWYVHPLTGKTDLKTLQPVFEEDRSRKVELGVFVRGDEYKLAGFLSWDRHLFGPKHPGPPVYFLGADRAGRDVLSRTLYGAQVSLSIGLLGVAVSLLLGLVLGGISGYFGGLVDTVIQRVIEFIMSVPTLPLWLGLAAAVPPQWGPLKTYLMITVILSLLGWTNLARVIRGRFLQTRNEDYVLAARLDGVPRRRIIGRHMLPAFTSHIIATVSLAVPAMILAETALSFLGLGLRAPAVSWGVLLQEAQSVRVLATAPWLLLPGIAVVAAVMAYNFVGDGLRDSADPYEN